MYPYTFSRQQLAQLDRALEALSTMGVLDSDEQERAKSLRRILRSAENSMEPSRNEAMLSFSEKDSQFLDKVMDGMW